MTRRTPTIPCTGCGLLLRPDYRRKTSLCRVCCNRLPRDPEAEERRKAKIRMTFAARPELAEQARERARNAMTAERRAAAAEAIRSHRSWEKTPTAARTSWQRSGVLAAIESRIGWCPPELRALYRDLTKRKGLRAADARALVMAQHEKDMADFRRSIGVK